MSIALKQTVVPSYGRHETFTLRHTWAKRGYDLVADPNYLSQADALRANYYPFNEADVHHTLGVGKNMARSIRFWLQACRLVEERKEGRATLGSPTTFGQALLDDVDGLDPYLEDPGTWWLLHWMMVSPGSHLPVWWAAFHTYNAVSFTTDQLFDHVRAQIEATSSWRVPKPPSDATVRRDVLALLRNYAGTAGSRRRDSIDDALDAPFVPLTLVRPADASNAYRFGIGPKPGLAPAVAAFACLDFLSRTEFSGRQALVASLTSEHGSPGRAFKLTEDDLGELLELAAHDAPEHLDFHEVGGSHAISVRGEDPLGVVAARVLHRYYVGCGSSAPEPLGPYLPWSEETELGEEEKVLRLEGRGWT